MGNFHIVTITISVHTTFPQANNSGFAKLQICHSWYACMNGEFFYDFKVEKDFISLTPRPETKGKY